MPDKHIDFWPLRYRAASGDDPDYDALGLPPNTGIYTVAGAAAGNYVHRLTDLLGNTLLEISAAFDTDNTGTAAAIAAAINTAAALKDSLASQYIYAATANAATFRVHYKYTQEFLVEHDVPAGSITAAPGDRWPMAVPIHAGNRPGGYPPSTTWEFKVKAVDVNGDFLPNVGTYSAQVLCGDSFKIPPDTTEKWDNSTRGTLAGSVGETHRVEVNGTGEITVLLTSLAAIHASADQLIIDAHPVVL